MANIVGINDSIIINMVSQCYWLLLVCVFVVIIINRIILMSSSCWLLVTET